MTEAPLDPYDLNRFVEAQHGVYDQALAEIRAARKRSHWMWFIFPQFEGLGVSPTAQHFAIKSLEEARAYLAHPVLGRRLSECAGELLELKTASASEIFGYPDDHKLQSSATLFAQVSPQASEFHRLLDKFFAGEPDRKTLALVK
jgi:uncharacterized protein (DUF1810 family)